MATFKFIMPVCKESIVLLLIYGTFFLIFHVGGASDIDKVHALCKFSQYLIFHPSSDSSCESAVNDFVEHVENCEFEKEKLTVDIEWQNTRNYSEEGQKQKEAIDDSFRDSSMEEFKAARHMWDTCVSHGGKSQLKEETRRLLGMLAEGYQILDKKESKTSEDLKTAIKGIYNFGEVCNNTQNEHSKECYRIEPDLANLIQKERDYYKAKWIFEQYRNELIPKIKPFWLQYRGLQNKWAQKLNLSTASESWINRYDTTMENYKAEWGKILSEIKPLYRKMHAYLRHKLGLFYGFDKVDQNKPIPAHLTGNLWNQQFKVYDITQPFTEIESIDTTKSLKKAFGDNVTALLEHCVKFYYDLGFEKLPDSFWTKSDYTEPKPPQKADCHGSANPFPDDDLRLSMCGKVDHDTYMTMVHELGHIFYYHYYRDKRYLYREGANAGFHEAIGDTFQFLAAGVPELIKQGWVDKKLAEDKESLHKIEISKLVQVACDELMFLPNGILFDSWVVNFDEGKIPEDKLNTKWWEMTKELQGITTPDGKARGENYFDVASKYHVANFYDNYSRYTLAKIYKFQFLKSLCEEQFNKGVPLHNCNLAGNKNATKRFREMLKMGASKPWPEAMQKATGQPDLDVQPLKDYFAPLEQFLDGYIKQNALNIGW